MSGKLMDMAKQWRNNGCNTDRRTHMKVVYFVKTNSFHHGKQEAKEGYALQTVKRILPFRLFNITQSWNLFATSAMKRKPNNFRMTTKNETPKRRIQSTIVAPIQILWKWQHKNGYLSAVFREMTSPVPKDLLRHKIDELRNIEQVRNIQREENSECFMTLSIAYMKWMKKWALS